MFGNELTVPTGIETAPTSPQLTRSTGAWKVILAGLRDQTDRQPEVLQESEWLLGATAPAVKLRGNAFAVEHTLDGTGRVFLCLAPLPDSRAIRSDWDLQVGPDGTVALNQENGYSWVQAAYSGGRWGRIAAAHALQRTLRPYDPRVHGLFMTNTWGDRARDAHLNSDFLLRELTAATALGVEVVEIDDGWQKGTSANSSKSGGIWNGFWEGDPQFWDVNPERFPDGLAAIAAQARKEGLKLGLWFAPDSSGEAKNWSRDAEVLLRIHRDLGVDFFKIDALKITTAASEENYRRLFAAVHAGAQAPVTFDFDVTAEHRFGYLGLVDGLFVENRYTDFGNYLPHQTLRAAWSLSHWIDPVRLRMEWLNHARNPDRYGDNPLAPARWRPDTLFAITMFSSPLGFFETQNLPASYLALAAPLIATWKDHRETLFRGDILPIGEAPDGVAWTGFVSIAADRCSGYALIFRELNSSSTYDLRLPLLEIRDAQPEVLGGRGQAALRNGLLSIEIPEKLDFVWMRF